MTLQTERVRTLEQVRVFVEGSEPVDLPAPGANGITRWFGARWCGWTFTAWEYSRFDSRSLVPSSAVVNPAQKDDVNRRKRVLMVPVAITANALLATDIVCKVRVPVPFGRQYAA